MSILNYVKSLVPSLEKRTILEDINNSLGELKTATIPAYKLAQKPMGSKTFTFKDPDVIAFNKKFNRDNKTGINGNFIYVIYEVAQRIEDNGSTLIKVVEEMFGSGVIADAITYRKASILKYVEAMTFFQRYARCLLRTVYIKETNMVDESVNEHENINNFELEWLAKNEDDFIGSLLGLSLKSSIFVSSLKETPDSVVNSDNIDIVSKVSGGKIDPFKLNFINANLNIIYHIRMYAAEWQHANYEAALQERKTIELRIMHMQNILDGKKDPKLEEQILYNEGRLDKLNYKIKKMEEKYE